MGVTEIPNESDHDGRFGEYREEFTERKRQLEAYYCEKRADRAAARGEFGTAADYLDRALSLRGKLGDRDASIRLGERLVVAARENGELARARTQLERLADLHARSAKAPEALAVMEEIISIAERQGDDDGLEEWWGNALMALGQAEPGEISDERRDELVSQYAEKIHTQDSASRLYGFALQKLVTGEEEMGLELLEATWERRDVVETNVDVYGLVLAAGVILAGYDELSDADVSVDADDLLDSLEDDRESMSERVEALFEKLHKGETDADPADFRPDVEAGEPKDLRMLEGEVVADLLEK